MAGIVSNTSSLRGIIDDVEMNSIKHPHEQLRMDGYAVSDLAASIKEKGLLHPIVIRPTGRFYEIVAGNRRYEACKSLGWRKITCHVQELDDKEAFEIGLVENVQRMTFSPIEEARAFKSYVSRYGWGGTTHLAQRLSKSVSYITKRIALLELPADVIECIDNFVLSTSAGEELCSIKDQTKQSELAKIIARRHLSIRKIRALAENKELPLEETFTIGLDPNYRSQKSIEKTVLILRLALNRLGLVIDGIDEQHWPLREMLQYHRNTIHGQIDSLLRHKKRHDRENSER